MRVSKSVRQFGATIDSRITHCQVALALSGVDPFIEQGLFEPSEEETRDHAQTEDRKSANDDSGDSCSGQRRVRPSIRRFLISSILNRGFGFVR